MNAMNYSMALLIGLFCLACQSKKLSTDAANQADSSVLIKAKSQSVADLEKQILALHDSVMPAMSDLMKLRKQVTEQLGELEKEPMSADVRQRKERALAIKAALDKADTSMMDWMHTYNGDTLVQLTEQQAMAYLKDQRQRVNAMSQLMRKSIDDAKAYLK
ncbi:hypothetical protein [Spirosoma aerolatum]|uniref:hypothetical protein n=1 Tax=Spirosoma aerolatum TaxID=1211326 RepID=UPI0009AEAC55|nr:hypothetical protein [Spirosoma aerolatum]